MDPATVTAAKETAKQTLTVWQWATQGKKLLEDTIAKCNEVEQELSELQKELRDYSGETNKLLRDHAERLRALEVGFEERSKRFEDKIDDVVGRCEQAAKTAAALVVTQIHTDVAVRLDRLERPQTRLELGT